jgi:putative transposase
MQLDVEGLVVRRLASVARAATTGATASATATGTARSDPIALRIAELRRGSYFPAVLEPRRSAEKTEAAVVQEAYVQGISTSLAPS